jgi:hypothetical protein
MRIPIEFRRFPSTTLHTFPHHRNRRRNMHATPRLLTKNVARDQQQEEKRQQKTYAIHEKCIRSVTRVVLRDLNEISLLFFLHIATFLVVFCTECDFSVSQEIYVMF